MSQPVDIQLYSLEEILEKLRSQAKSLPVSPTSSRYLHALNSLSASIVGTHGSCVRELSKERAAGLSQGETEYDTAAEAADTEPLAPILQAALADWLVSLWLNATPFSTASLYLDIISSLYGSAVRDGQLPPTKVFSHLKADLKALGPAGWKKGIDDEIFARALRLTKNSARLISDDSISADLVIWSLTHALQPLQEIAMLKRDDIMGGSFPKLPMLSDGKRPLSESEQTIVARQYGNARRKYIFLLRQSERTPKQLSVYIAKIVNALFKRARLPQATDPFQTVEALWAYAALRSGIPASQIVAYLGHAPLGLPVLKLSVMGGRFPNRPVRSDAHCDNAENEAVNTARSANTEPQAPILSAQRADTSYCGTAADTFKENFSAVGKIFLENPPRWYAMSLRPGVRFTQVCRRIQLLAAAHTEPKAPILRASLANTARSADTSLSDIRLFYPCEEIARAIGKKVVIRERPFIHSVVFFRARITDIGRLFAKIGDLAWCYRQSARPGAPYADISERQFKLFQQTIAQFTPDYEVAPTGELELKKNDRVQIVGGLFAGQEATVDSIDTSYCEADTQKDTAAKAADTPSTVYRLNIIGENGIEWRINLDSRLIKHK